MGWWNPSRTRGYWLPFNGDPDAVLEIVRVLNPRNASGYGL